MTIRAPPVRLLRQAIRPRIHNAPLHATRNASTSANPPLNRARNLLYGSVAVAAVSLGFLYITDTRASVHEHIAPPVLRLLFPDAEDAHHAGTRALKELYTFGVYPRERGAGDLDGTLSIEAFGHVLANPIGISGGLDKNADIPDPLFALGPAVVEVGGITPLPQAGNPQPRVFRVASQNALINRYGLNSEGADVVAMRLRQRVREYAYSHGFGMDENAEKLVLDGQTGVPPGSLVPGRLLAVQIAKNKVTSDTDLDAVVQDHVYCVDRLGKYADILVVNVSSPNTPGLRSLQSKKPLTQILSAVVDAANSVDRKTKPVVMVKVSPDEDSETQIQGIVDAVYESGVGGVIVGNTTMKRPDAVPAGYILPEKDGRALLETGGYSGPQLFSRTKALVAKYRKALDGGPTEDIPEPLPPKPSKPAAIPAPSAPDHPETSIAEEIKASVKRDEANLKPLDDKSATGQGDGGRELHTGLELPESSSENQPVIRLPERNSPFSSSDNKPSGIPAPVAISTQTPSEHSEPAPALQASGRSKAFATAPKVIFASGGITTGEEALEVLNAGASVAMMYTGIVYGGVGTVGRVKSEMRNAINGQSKK
ncbi:dihydroorotate dehydrogenase [Venturia nashicola]|nr:dihydroorotate dehydrogenase [Venturia nashicola]